MLHARVKIEPARLHQVVPSSCFTTGDSGCIRLVKHLNLCEEKPKFQGVMLGNKSLMSS